MNKLPILILSLMAVHAAPACASFLHCETAETLHHHFSVSKVFETPKIEEDETTSSYTQKLAIVQDNEFNAALLSTPSFKAIMELPQIPYSALHGSYQAFIQSGFQIHEKKQGVASFFTTPEPKTAPHYVGTTNILNCVGVVLDQFQTLPHQGGFMHVDEKEFTSGRFGRLLDCFDTATRPQAKVTLTSCFFSPLLDNVIQTLVNKGFRIVQGDITPAYTNHGLRLIPLCMTGVTLEKALSSNNLHEVFQNSALATDGPKIMIYDFHAHRHHHLGFPTSNINNAALERYFTVLKTMPTKAQIPQSAVPVMANVTTTMGRAAANTAVEINLQAIMENARDMPEDQLMAMCAVLNKLGRPDLVALLNKEK